MEQSLPEFYVPYNKFQEFGSLNLTQFIREIVAPESLFRDKAKEVQEKLIDFYETREKPQDADYKFYLDRYTQVKRKNKCFFEYYRFSLTLDLLYQRF